MDTGERALLIVNPRASSVRHETLAPLERLLASAGPLETVLTSGRLDATRIAAEASRDASIGALYVYSGDGVFNEVINGLERRLPVGFIPGGHTNVLTRALGLGRDALPAAARVAGAARAGRRRAIALGRANGRRFAISSGIGLDAAFVRSWERLSPGRDGRKRGDLAFALAAFRVLARMRGAMGPGVELAGHGRAAFVLVANCDPYSYAGRVPLHVAPGLSLEEGAELVAVRELHPWMIPGFIGLMLRGRAPRSERRVLRLRPLHEITVRSLLPLPFQVDGEDLGDVTEVVFSSEPDALDVIA